MTETSGDFRERAHALIDRLPRNATWDDLARQAAARRDLEEEDENDLSGRVAEEVLREYELMKAEIARVSPDEAEEYD